MRILTLSLFSCALFMEPGSIRAQEQPRITIISVKDIDPAEAVWVIEYLYRDTPGLTVEALPKLKCVAIRTDARTTRDVEELIRKLDKPADPDIKAFSNVGRNRLDPAALFRALRAIRAASGAPEYTLGGFATSIGDLLGTPNVFPAFLPGGIRPGGGKSFTPQQNEK